MSSLKGKRVLLVEDEFLIAMMTSDALSEMGVVVLGPAATLGQTLDLIQTETFDAALLDINLNGERSEPAGEALRARNIPFIVLTGYGRDDWQGPEAPVLNKPYAPEKLIRILQHELLDRQA